MPISAKDVIRYRNGGDGFVAWAEENVRIPIYPPGSAVPDWMLIKDLPETKHKDTGRSPAEFWRNMAKVARASLIVGDDGLFIFRLIVFCWMRGEAKSLLTCLIQLWKFYCFPRQLIVFAANSKDQVKFVHFDITKDIILNSPKLLAITGRKNIQEKEIRLKNRAGAIMSTIRSISSFSGIVSNITGYTFSEIFDLKNPKFFYQLDGSIRNIPNALGIIDSTVSSKRHVLHRLYKIWEKKKDPTLFFSHRFSLRADYRDYWHPAMTRVQLMSYRTKFPKAEFEQYFKNTWESGSKRLFTPALIKATHFIGFGKQLGVQNTILKSLTSCLAAHKAIKALDCGLLPYDDVGSKTAPESLMNRKKLSSSIQEQLVGLRKTNSIYQLVTPAGVPKMATREELGKLTDLYDTDWALLVGLDRSDPLKEQSGARTLLTAIAKGLPGSKSNPEIMYDLGVKSYIYFVLHLTVIQSARIDDIKLELASVHSEFDGIETVCGERWGLWDLGTWCTENEVLFLPVQPTRERQKEAFTELFQLYKSGLFKSPPIGVPGSKGRDILVEEALYFDYSPKLGIYGSPEKDEKYGVQDDAMYSVAWGIWGGKNITMEDFRSRTAELVFGEFRKATDLVGRY